MRSHYRSQCELAPWPDGRGGRCNSQAIAVKNNTEDIQKNNLLVVVTPDGECVGIKVKYGMPDTFDTDQSRHEWLNTG